MKTLILFLSLLLAASGYAAPNTNTVTFNWVDFGFSLDSVTNRATKITPLEYATIGSFFMVKTPRIYTNSSAGVCIVTNWQAGSYRVELPTSLGSITVFTSTVPSTATGSSNYDATAFVTNDATNSGSTRSYSITVSDLRYPSVAGTNIVFYTNAGRITIAGTTVSGTSPAVASNYLWATKLDTTNGNAYNIAFTTNAEWRGPLATNSFMQNGHKFMIRDTRSADCWIEYTNRADGTKPWTFFESPTTFGRSQADYIYSKGAALYLSSESLQDKQVFATGDAAFYIYGTNILHGTANWLFHDNATDLTTFAGDLTVGGFFVSTNMNAKISSASNIVHTALNATNTILAANISSLNTAANNNAANVTSISNRVIQAEVTNAVQQTALDGLTNSIGTKQLGSAALTNLSAQVNTATNIIGAGFGIIVSSNNAGTWTITGATTNYVATTNGMSRDLTNLGNFASGSISTTNITNATMVASSTITAAGAIRSTGGTISTAAATGIGPGNGSIFTFFNQGNSGNYDEVAFYRSDSTLLGMMTFGYGTGAGTPALMVTNGNIFLGNATRTFNASTTNSTTVAGLRVGFQAFSAVLTNVFTTNVVWDFPSTTVGFTADLSATITGVKDGDMVYIGPPAAVMSGIIGSYSGFASNNTAWGRFTPTASNQNPASGTFRVIVEQYR
jgi:hypothetical protein